MNFFGSKASRIASPIKVTSVRTTTIAQKAELTIHGACSAPIPWRNNSPQLGVGGGSLVYANTLFEPPETVWDDPQWRGLEDWRKVMPSPRAFSTSVVR